MKRNIAIIVMLLLFSSFAFADDEHFNPAQNPDAPFRLFNTQNIHTLLKLNTRTGQIWQVQWGDKEYRFTSPLNPKELISNGNPGRFSLYPTKNIFTFILIDQETGDTWQVQWGEIDERLILSID